jgi:hypothetical protein
MTNSQSHDDMRSSTVGAEELFLESGVSTHHIPNLLPHERVFPVQLGSELFKLSGASISSDGASLAYIVSGYGSTHLTNICSAPSYFSQYFICQVKRAEEAGQDIGSAIRTLYIDRDPITFRDISLHLQGYHVQPRDPTHFVRLFADAQFYHRETYLPTLTPHHAPPPPPSQTHPLF